MPLHDERIMPYVQMAGLAHLARLNDHWFRLDEPLVSAFVERWRSETHTFHMPFGECTITLQDVAYHLGLPIDGQYISSCLMDFERYIEGGRPSWTWFEKLLGCCHRRTASTSSLSSGTSLVHARMRIQWLPYVVILEDMGGYSWGSAALSWLYRCLCRVANKHVVKLAGPLQLFQSWIFWRFPGFRLGGFVTRWSGYQPTSSEKGPRIAHCRLHIDLLRPGDVIRLDAVQLARRHAGSASRDIRVTSHNIMDVYDVIDILCCHRVTSGVDRVLPQLGGVQYRPLPALNIDLL
ncbi:hypothetical protein Ahy_B02g059047 [Arachis hypogaea]|uniref:Aminotransferase-like plant mobile domain-containing protein n=1 Tax=Arachis hypogaea TaxID=3818 RepID=A0A445AFZ9_ARAHY|nr:hypothetical protein Ahy_B02g059047 [Arachis hypogaea]